MHISHFIILAYHTITCQFHSCIANYFKIFNESLRNYSKYFIRGTLADCAPMAMLTIN